MQKHVEIGVAGRALEEDYLIWAEKLAKDFDIQGAIKMEHDGSIKIIAEGEEENLEKFVDGLRHGTSHEIYNFYDKWSKRIDGMENFIILNN